jgi:hypothetical protein
MRGLEPPPDFDLYRELGVDPSARPEAIEAAWRSLVKRHHPDVNRRARPERIRRINIAHDWLSDPELRARYDATRPRRRPPTRTHRPAARSGPPTRPATPDPVPLPKAPTPARRRLSSAAVRALSALGRVVGYFVWCLVSIGIAYVASVVATAFLGPANFMTMIFLFFGEDVGWAVLQLLGNLIFAAAYGFFVASGCQALRRREGDVGELTVVGAGTALAVTFGFPVVASLYLPWFVRWFATEGDGLRGVLAISAIEALVVGLVVAAAAWIRPWARFTG